GEKIGLITEVASGGELSRIMLAIKVALSIYDSKATIIFDEVDAGIGGTVALAVANMISRLSLTHQVLVITHLPQIACKADYHYLVSKKEVEGRTVSNIVQLRDEDRVKEIARLLSGDTSNISIEHARALLKV
ncbi:MAG: DNA repair protein RecN, partial [Spirochaetales bacterium]|nr:DNA repair protein RecN [Spirochaetales bacterium]